jgi:hypothetical protein
MESLPAPIAEGSIPQVKEGAHTTWKIHLWEKYIKIPQLKLPRILKTLLKKISYAQRTKLNLSPEATNTAPLNEMMNNFVAPFTNTIKSHLAKTKTEQFQNLNYYKVNNSRSSLVP